MTLKFMDGSPVPEEYEAAVAKMVREACIAEELIGLDELDERPKNKEES